MEELRYLCMATTIQAVEVEAKMRLQAAASQCCKRLLSRSATPVERTSTLYRISRSLKT